MKLKKKHNRNSGTSTHENQERQVLNSMVLHLHLLRKGIIYQMMFGFAIVAQAVSTVSLWKG
jgi:hypothetical protein